MNRLARRHARAPNGPYVARLASMGCRAGEINPVGRGNLGPILEVSAAPSFFAITNVVPEPGAAGDFLVSVKPGNREGVTVPRGSSAAMMSRFPV